MGQYQGDDAAVLAEAKHNMDTSTSKARSEIFTAHAYWTKLCGASRDELNEEERADYDALHIEQHKHARVMFALGCMKFSDTVAARAFGDLKTPWFRVGFSPSQNSSFKVVSFSPGVSDHAM